MEGSIEEREMALEEGWTAFLFVECDVEQGCAGLLEFLTLTEEGKSISPDIGAVLHEQATDRYCREVAGSVVKPG